MFECSLPPVLLLLAQIPLHLFLLLAMVPDDSKNNPLCTPQSGAWSPLTIAHPTHKVDGFRRRFSPEILTVPSATGNVKFPFLCGVNTSFALSLSVQSRLVFLTNRVMFDQCTKRHDWSVKGHSEQPFIGCLPIRQQILNAWQIAITLHGIRPPFFVQTGQQYRRCPFFDSAHCSFCNSTCF